jgi:hypothetical protein
MVCRQLRQEFWPLYLDTLMIRVDFASLVEILSIYKSDKATLSSVNIATQLNNVYQLEQGIFDTSIFDMDVLPLLDNLRDFGILFDIPTHSSHS